MIELRPGGRPLKVGHRGAPVLAPENTLRSLGAAIAGGVDVVEIDVFDLADGTLVLAHSDDLLEVSHGAASGRVHAASLDDLRRVAPELPTLDEALDFVARRDVGVQVDVKAWGHERRIAEALSRHDLAGRSFVSSSSIGSLRAFAAAAPSLPRALTYPDDRYGVSRRRVVEPFVAPALRAMRRILPYRLGPWLRRARADAATLHQAVVSRAAVAVCHRLGLPVYAWTVNDADVGKALLEAGVDGIISDDPAIFSHLPLET